MRDDTTTATNTAAVRVSGSMCTGVGAAGARRWWRNLTPTQRTKDIRAAGTAAAPLLLFAVCLAVMVQQYQAQSRDLECQWYGQLYEWDLPNDDSCSEPPWTHHTIGWRGPTSECERCGRRSTVANPPVLLSWRMV
jgi:hypothetical protein